MSQQHSGQLPKEFVDLEVNALEADIIRTTKKLPLPITAAMKATPLVRFHRGAFWLQYLPATRYWKRLTDPDTDTDNFALRLGEDYTYVINPSKELTHRIRYSGVPYHFFQDKSTGALIYVAPRWFVLVFESLKQLDDLVKSGFVYRKATTVEKRVRCDKKLPNGKRQYRVRIHKIKTYGWKRVADDLREFAYTNKNVRWLLCLFEQTKAPVPYRELWKFPKQPKLHYNGSIACIIIWCLNRYTINSLRNLGLQQSKQFRRDPIFLQLWDDLHKILKLCEDMLKHDDLCSVDELKRYAITYIRAYRAIRYIMRRSRSYDVRIYIDRYLSALSIRLLKSNRCTSKGNKRKILLPRWLQDEL